MTTLAFNQSKWYTAGRTASGIEVVVLHTTESKGNAVQTAHYATYRPRKGAASAHYYVDNLTIVQGVRIADTAWAAPPTNPYGIQIEQCGFAAWSKDEWLNDHLGTLCNTARLLAHCFRRCSVPIIPVDAAGLKAHHHGTTTHVEVNRAFGISNHTDPGKGYPMTEVMQLAWGFVREGNEDIDGDL